MFYKHFRLDNFWKKNREFPFLNSLCQCCCSGDMDMISTFSILMNQKIQTFVLEHTIVQILLHCVLCVPNVFNPIKHKYYSILVLFMISFNCPMTDQQLKQLYLDQHAASRIPPRHLIGSGAESQRGHRLGLILGLSQLMIIFYIQISSFYDI